MSSCVSSLKQAMTDNFTIFFFAKMSQQESFLDLNQLTDMLVGKLHLSESQQSTTARAHVKSFDEYLHSKNVQAKKTLKQMRKKKARGDDLEIEDRINELHSFTLFISNITDEKQLVREFNVRRA